ncbi:Trp biosynthesis-associated membrane protein [Thermoactinospora rubra]|uniref:Trp biosynthesis-associated membrane protein n=1 Tax=Thermoactinospora rubra TaxID=1088767 RepID=UPI001301C240|nr:Trp biosynthesis-associated membrane protein [Thermoactinospora rubra]
MTGRRELWLWLAGTALGCGLALLAAGREWAVATGGTPAAATGAELSPALTPVALAGLAGVVAVLATRGLGRRLVAAVVALCGLAAVLAAWSATSAGRVRAELSEQLVAAPAWQTTVWPAVAVVGGVLTLAGGLLAVVRGGRWAGMSDRYGRRAPRERDTSLWEALDRGEDPTDRP